MSISFDILFSESTDFIKVWSEKASSAKLIIKKNHIYIKHGNSIITLEKGAIFNNKQRPYFTRYISPLLFSVFVFVPLVNLYYDLKDNSSLLESIFYFIISISTYLGVSYPFRKRLNNIWIEISYKDLPQKYYIYSMHGVRGFSGALYHNTKIKKLMENLVEMNHPEGRQLPH